jgi:hypothetical protein
MVAPIRLGIWARPALAGLMLISACGRSHPSSSGDEPPPTPVPAAPTTSLPAASQGCRLPPGTGDGRRCPYDYATFVAPVDRSIENLMRQQPELFDFTQCFSALSCRVLDRERYLEGLLHHLRADFELCAVFDGEEIAIKNRNEFSDQYAVISSTGYSRWGIGSYRATCRPAWF